MKKLNTKRLLIKLMTDDELREAISSEPDEHLKQAYSEMLAGCTDHPESRLWYTPWQVALKESGEPVGGLGFKGPPKNGEVEIGYGIRDLHRERGYA
ncbi:MAG: N-acetyltransferase, partial [Clostridia bacterium]|nr:N-acetyltransferase [Clostridia bacterium]